MSDTESTESFKLGTRSGREALSAGARPKTTPVKTDKPKAKANTLQLKPTSKIKAIDRGGWNPASALPAQTANIKAYDSPGGGRQVSIDGGDKPVWAPSGVTLYYRNGSKMMAVEIRTEPTFAAGKPQLLFEKDYYGSILRTFDLSPDGQKFVMIQSEDQSTPKQIKVVQNWFEELKRLVPAN